MSHDRRQFLKFSSSFLTTLGISTLPIWQQSDRYARALSSTKGRKLALLVGINAYPIASYADLKGCTTDVELQKALLVNRFGFNPNDVLTLTNDTNDKPTRQNILTAFEEHLIKQAKPDDVVVFPAIPNSKSSKIYKTKSLKINRNLQRRGLHQA